MLKLDSPLRQRSINPFSETKIGSGISFSNLSDASKPFFPKQTTGTISPKRQNIQSPSVPSYSFARKERDILSPPTRPSRDQDGHSQNIEELVIRKIRIEQIFRKEKSPEKFERSSSNPEAIYASDKKNNSIRCPPHKPKRTYVLQKSIERKLSPSRTPTDQVSTQHPESNKSALLASSPKKKLDPKQNQEFFSKKVPESNQNPIQIKQRQYSKGRLRPMSPIERVQHQNIAFLNTVQRPKSLDEDDHLFTLKMIEIPPKKRQIQSAVVQKASPTTNDQLALDTFREVHKNVLREKEISEFKRIPQTPIQAILFHENSVNALPLKYGIVQIRNNPRAINISHYHLGDRGVDGFCIGLKEIKDLESINAKENGFSEIGTGKVFESLSSNLLEIDVSSNEVSKENIKQFFKPFDISNVQLHTIRMNRTQLSDDAADSLFIGLQYFKTLRILSLNSNRISNRSCYSLEDMIKSLSNLQELDLSWNIIQGEGATLILDASRQLNSLRTLNLAENLLGLASSPDIFTAAFSRLCGGPSASQTPQSNISSLNLSYNQFSMKQSEKILKIQLRTMSIQNFNFEGNQLDSITKF